MNKTHWSVVGCCTTTFIIIPCTIKCKKINKNTYVDENGNIIKYIDNITYNVITTVNKKKYAVF